MSLCDRELTKRFGLAMLFVLPCFSTQHLSQVNRHITTHTTSFPTTQQSLPRPEGKRPGAGAGGSKGLAAGEAKTAAGGPKTALVPARVAAVHDWNLEVTFGYKVGFDVALLCGVCCWGFKVLLLAVRIRFKKHQRAHPAHPVCGCCCDVFLKPWLQSVITGICLC